MKTQFPEDWLYRLGFVAFGVFMGVAWAVIADPRDVWLDLLGVCQIATLGIGMLGGFVAIYIS